MSEALARRWLLLAAESIGARWQELTDLDAAIGDGDHGVNMDRGFREVRRLLADPAQSALSSSETLALAGRTILGTVGGASGALYGRALVRAAERLAASSELATDTEIVASALEAALESVSSLGRSAPGQKTMLDALAPALAELRSAATATLPFPAALAAAATAAERGVATTIPMLALRGRASYLGERSIGHQDPGATSSALLLRALADAARQSEATEVA